MPDRLILMRHAKSDYPPGVVDHDRPLSPRGRRDAAAAGRWLAANIDQLSAGEVTVLVSSAVRAQQTWEIAGEGLALSARTEPRIYESSVSTLIGLADAELGNTVMIIGHNPTLESCAAHLLGESLTMKTSAIVAMGLAGDDPWASGSATRIAFATPRAN